MTFARGNTDFGIKFQFLTAESKSGVNFAFSGVEGTFTFAKSFGITFFSTGSGFFASGNSFLLGSSGFFSDMFSLLSSTVVLF